VVPTLNHLLEVVGDPARIAQPLALGVAVFADAEYPEVRYGLWYAAVVVVKEVLAVYAMSGDYNAHIAFDDDAEYVAATFLIQRSRSLGSLEKLNFLFPTEVAGVTILVRECHIVTEGVTRILQ